MRNWLFTPPASTRFARASITSDSDRLHIVIVRPSPGSPRRHGLFGRDQIGLGGGFFLQGWLLRASPWSTASSDCTCGVYGAQTETLQREYAANRAVPGRGSDYFMNWAVSSLTLGLLGVLVP